jgi:hypothetical protein
MQTKILDRSNQIAVIKPKQQDKYVKSAHRLKEPHRVLLYSAHDMLGPQICALMIYTKVAKRLLKKDIHHMMRWVDLSESFQEDKILIEMREGKIPNPLLVIDNVRPIASPKTNKIRKLLNFYPHPLFIIMNGEDAYKFWLKEYGSKPDMVIRIDRQSASKITEI